MRAAALLILLSLPAHAVGILRIDETKSIAVAVGVKTSVAATGGTPAGPRAEAQLEQALVSIAGDWNKTLKVQLNLGRAPTGELRLIDGISMFEPLDALKVWAGRFLVPTDRAALSGPYFSANWDASFVSIAPSVGAGRDDGLAVWGNLFNGHLKYQAGVFRGRVGGSNVAGNLLYAGRLTVEILEAEPSYYANGSWLGTKDVLAFAIGGRRQAQGAGTPEASSLFYAFNVDAFGEKTLGRFGTITGELAYFKYSNRSADPTVPNGEGYYGVAGYLLPFAVGPGKLQAVFRHQYLTNQGTVRVRDELTLNYFIGSAFLRVGLNGWWDAPANTYGVKLGAQLIL